MDTEMEMRSYRGRTAASSQGGRRNGQASRPAIPINSAERDGAHVPSIRPHGEFRPALTPREREALRMLANGYSADDVGRCLGITTNTVRAHMKHVRYKLAATSTAQAVYTAQKLGMI